MKKLWLLLLMCFVSYAQVSKKGAIMDSVSISENSDETFALYLPESYSLDQMSSIVFIFDPAGDGRRGIKPFISVSEKYGYILVSSNNTKNGPYSRNFDITNRLFDYVFDNFRIKQDEVYVSGFSGGSRLAAAIAVLTNNVAGVIGCGAGFSLEPSHIPTDQKFAYVGVCGNRDMNYQEMIRAKGYLQQLGFTNTLITYDGDHGWAPSEQLMKAFDWLEIQAHKKGVKSMPVSEIYARYRDLCDVALKAYQQNDLLAAVACYERVVTTYNSFYAVDSLTNRLKKIRRSKEYKRLIKSVSRAFDKENELSKMFVKRFFENYHHPDTIDMSWWYKEVNSLAAMNEDNEMKKMIERLRFQILATAYSINNPNLYSSNDQQKEFGKMICELMDATK